jgi:hypothetical protein
LFISSKAEVVKTSGDIIHRDRHKTEIEFEWISDEKIDGSGGCVTSCQLLSSDLLTIENPRFEDLGIYGCV